MIRVVGVTDCNGGRPAAGSCCGDVLCEDEVQTLWGFSSLLANFGFTRERVELHAHAFLVCC
jgi:hypothetical protein